MHNISILAHTNTSVIFPCDFILCLFIKIFTCFPRLRGGFKVSEKEERGWITAASAVPGIVCGKIRTARVRSVNQSTTITKLFITTEQLKRNYPHFVSCLKLMHFKAKTTHVDMPILLCKILFLQMYECKYTWSTF